MLEQFCKNVKDALDYTVDFYRFLQDEEVLQNVVCTISPDTMTASRLEYDDRKAKVWIMGGVDKEVYTVRFEITTNFNRRKTFDFQIRTLGEEAEYSLVSITDTTVLTGRLP